MVSALAEVPAPQPAADEPAASTRAPGKTGKGVFGRSMRAARASARTPPTPVVTSPETPGTLP